MTNAAFKLTSIRWLESIARYGALAAACVEWSSWLLFYVLRPHEFIATHPISYFATQPNTRVVFTIAYLVAPFCFWVYIKLHLKQAVPMFTVSMLGFAAVAIIPYHPENAISGTAHIGAFLLTSTTFLIGMFQVAAAAKDKLLQYCLLAIFGLSLVAYAGLLLSRGNGPVILYWELGWWVTCQFWMVSISVHDLRKSLRLV